MQHGAGIANPAAVVRATLFVGGKPRRPAAYDGKIEREEDQAQHREVGELALAQELDDRTTLRERALKQENVRPGSVVCDHDARLVRR